MLIKGKGVLHTPVRHRQPWRAQGSIPKQPRVLAAIAAASRRYNFPSIIELEEWLCNGRKKQQNTLWGLLETLPKYLSASPGDGPRVMSGILNKLPSDSGVVPIATRDVLLDVAKSVYEECANIANTLTPHHIQDLLYIYTFLYDVLEGESSTSSSTQTREDDQETALKWDAFKVVAQTTLDAALPNAITGATVHEVLACTRTLNRTGVLLGKRSAFSAQLVQGLSMPCGPLDATRYTDTCSLQDLADAAVALMSGDGLSLVTKDAVEHLKSAADRLIMDADLSATDTRKQYRGAQPTLKSKTKSSSPETHSSDVEDSDEHKDGGTSAETLDADGIEQAAVAAKFFLLLPEDVAIDRFWTYRLATKVLSCATRTPQLVKEPGCIVELCYMALRSHQWTQCTAGFHNAFIHNMCDAIVALDVARSSSSVFDAPAFSMYLKELVATITAPKSTLKLPTAFISALVTYWQSDIAYKDANPNVANANQNGGIDNVTKQHQRDRTCSAILECLFELSECECDESTEYGRARLAMKMMAQNVVKPVLDNATRFADTCSLSELAFVVAELMSEDGMKKLNKEVVGELKFAADRLIVNFKRSWSAKMAQRSHSPEVVDSDAEMSDGDDDDGHDDSVNPSSVNLDQTITVVQFFLQIPEEVAVDRLWAYTLLMKTLSWVRSTPQLVGDAGILVQLCHTALKSHLWARSSPNQHNNMVLRSCDAVLAVNTETFRESVFSAPEFTPFLKAVVSVVTAPESTLKLNRQFIVALMLYARSKLDGQNAVLDWRLLQHLNKQQENSTVVAILDALYELSTCDCGVDQDYKRTRSAMKTVAQDAAKNLVTSGFRFNEARSIDGITTEFQTDLQKAFTRLEAVVFKAQPPHRDMQVHSDQEGTVKDHHEATPPDPGVESACVTAPERYNVSSITELEEWLNDSRNYAPASQWDGLIALKKYLSTFPLHGPRLMSGVLKRLSTETNFVTGAKRGELLDVAMSVFQECAAIADNLAPDQIVELLYIYTFLHDLPRVQSIDATITPASKDDTLVDCEWDDDQLRAYVITKVFVKQALDAALPHAITGATVQQVLACTRALNKTGLNIEKRSAFEQQLAESLALPASIERFTDTCSLQDLADVVAELMIEDGMQALTKDAVVNIKSAADRLIINANLSATDTRKQYRRLQPMRTSRTRSSSPKADSSNAETSDEHRIDDGGNAGPSDTVGIEQAAVVAQFFLLLREDVAMDRFWTYSLATKVLIGAKSAACLVQDTGCIVELCYMALHSHQWKQCTAGFHNAFIHDTCEAIIALSAVGSKSSVFEAPTFPMYLKGLVATITAPESTLKLPKAFISALVTHVHSDFAVGDSKPNGAIENVSEQRQKDGAVNVILECLSELSECECDESTEYGRGRLAMKNMAEDAVKSLLASETRSSEMKAKADLQEPLTQLEEAGASNTTLDRDAQKDVEQQIVDNYHGLAGKQLMQVTSPDLEVDSASVTAPERYYVSSITELEEWLIDSRNYAPASQWDGLITLKKYLSAFPLHGPRIMSGVLKRLSFKTNFIKGAKRDELLDVAMSVFQECAAIADNLAPDQIVELLYIYTFLHDKLEDQSISSSEDNEQIAHKWDEFKLLAQQALNAALPHAITGATVQQVLACTRALNRTGLVIETRPAFQAQLTESLALPASIERFTDTCTLPDLADVVAELMSEDGMKNLNKEAVSNIKSATDRLVMRVKLKELLARKQNKRSKVVDRSRSPDRDSSDAEGSNEFGDECVSVEHAAIVAQFYLRLPEGLAVDDRWTFWLTIKPLSWIQAKYLAVKDPDYVVELCYATLTSHVWKQTSPNLHHVLVVRICDVLHQLRSSKPSGSAFDAPMFPALLKALVAVIIAPGSTLKVTTEFIRSLVAHLRLRCGNYAIRQRRAASRSTQADEEDNILSIALECMNQLVSCECAVDTEYGRARMEMKGAALNAARALRDIDNSSKETSSNSVAPDGPVVDKTEALAQEEVAATAADNVSSQDSAQDEVEQPTPMEVGLQVRLVTGEVQMIVPGSKLALVKVAGVDAQCLLEVQDFSSVPPQAGLSSVLKPGDKIKAVLMNHNASDGHLTLSTRELEPWPGAMLTHPGRVFDMAERLWAIRQQLYNESFNPEATMSTDSSTIAGSNNDRHVGTVAATSDAAGSLKATPSMQLVTQVVTSVPVSIVDGVKTIHIQMTDAEGVKLWMQHKL